MPDEAGAESRGVSPVLPLVDDLIEAELDADHLDAPPDVIFARDGVVTTASDEVLRSASAPLITRAEWRARPPRSALARIGTVHGVALHHAGPRMGWPWPHERCYDKVRAIQNFHMGTRDWVDIAYTALVCNHGFIFVGRWVGARTAANGTRDANAGYYAICGLWGTGDGFTDAAKIAFLDGIERLRAAGAGRDVKGHRQFKATTCPDDPVQHWIDAGCPRPGGPPPPVPPPKPPPKPQPQQGVRERTAELQRLVGVPADGIWGPNTASACNRNLIGWETYVRMHGYRGALPGNGKRDLVRWLQRQLNRRGGGGFVEDGVVGPNTNHGIVKVLGQRDGICGPNGFRLACS